MAIKQKDNIELRSINDLESSRVITRDENGEPVSYLYDQNWNFEYSRAFSTSEEDREVKFGGIPQEFKKDVQNALAKMLEKNPAMALATIKYERGNLVRIASLIGTSDWSLLDKEFIFRKFKSEIKSKKLGISTVKGTLITVNQLFNLGLTKRLIKNIKETSEKLASEFKRVKFQHIAIPEQMATTIYSKAELVLNKYYPFRTEISNAYSRYFRARQSFVEEDPSNEPKRFWQIIGHKLPHEVDIEGFEVRSNSDELDQIKIACLILILGYSGVRHGEGVSIGRKSYGTKSYNEFEIPYLVGFSTKKNEAGLPTKETWITHPIVEKALELLFSITDFAREIYKEKYANNAIKLAVINNGLLSTDIARHKSNVLWSPTSVTSNLNKFLKVHSIVATEQDVIEFDKLNPTRKGFLKVGGFLPKLSSHDFRRTFAVFLVRNKLGSIMALKHQYKHLNVLMTKWYSNNSELVRALDLQIDRELQDMVEEANIMIMTEAAFEVFNSPTLSGGEGKRIKGEREKRSYNGRVYISKKELNRQVRNGNLSIVEHPTGFCFNPSCDRICASELSGVTCMHEAITREKALERLPKRERLIKKVNNLIPLGPAFASIRNRLFVEIKAMEHVLQEHNIPFDPFQEQMSD